MDYKLDIEPENTDADYYIDFQFGGIAKAFGLTIQTLGLKFTKVFEKDRGANGREKG